MISEGSSFVQVCNIKLARTARFTNTMGNQRELNFTHFSDKSTKTRYLYLKSNSLNCEVYLCLYFA